MTLVRGLITRRRATLGVLAVVSTAATLMIAAGSASALKVDPRGGTTSVDYARTAPNPDGFTATTTRDLARADTIDRQLAAAAEQGPPQWVLDRCLEHEDAGKLGGHVMFRHFWCQRNVVYGNILNPITLEQEGEFTLRFRAAAIANPFTREVHYFFHGDDYDADGSFSGHSSLSLRAHCIELTAGCSVDRNEVTMDIGDWDDGQWVRWNFRSDERVATQQPEKVLRNKFTLSGDATDDFFRTAVLEGQTKPGFRCDSATYFRYAPQACVFTDVLPRLPHPYGAGYDEVVTHIKGAYERPDLTHPFLAGKSIPGRWPTDSRALHRVPYMGAIWTKNRDAKNVACATLPPRLPDQDCDEFPFASTYEGAGLGDGNFSVKYLNDEQNRRSGRVLRDYYRWDRILYEQSPGDGTVLDEFWVNVP
jgi:hypothetical protein